MCRCITGVHNLLLFLGLLMALLLLGLLPWPLLVSTVLCQTVELAHGRSLRLLGSSRESFLWPWYPTYTTLKYGQVPVVCVWFWADFIGFYGAPSIWSFGFSAVGTSFPTTLCLLLVPSLFQFGKTV